MHESKWFLSGLLVSAALLLAVHHPSRAGDISFTEDFALAQDRTEALQQLIPGSEEYYFYQCLHHQNAGKLEEVDKLLKPWIDRHGRTGKVVEIENRQALLRYPRDSKASLEFLRNRLGLQWNHQREVLGEKLQLPTSLDPKLISREALTQRALERHPRTLDGFADPALEWLAASNLDADRRRNLLSRLRRPDIPNLPHLVVADLKHKDSGGFGCFEIHRLLLQDQLDECLKLKPDLLNQGNFVAAYLVKLCPSPDEDWQADARAREAYLDRLWSFASRLSPAHNSLKAHILYRRLAHDRALGTYDKSRFMEYIKLPRNVPYINRAYLAREENRRNPADLGANYQGATGLPSVGNDEPLVRSYLERFFLTEEDFSPYAAYLMDDYLKQVFAETKILAGLGDMEKWYSMIPPANYQALKERVDIDFDPANKTTFAADEQVALDLYVKNVKTLIVKVFELSALNFYRENLREIDTAIDLDGLVANEEKTQEYGEPALRRVKRHFEFPSISKRGTYVVEFIGSGKASRALIRKGKLQFLSRASTAGQVFTLLDETHRKLSDASIWLSGREYRAEKDGTITVPFSNQPGRQPIVLVHGDFATLDSFDHESEEYRLAAGIHVEREALLTRAKCKVLVRPVLTVNGAPVTLSVLEEPTLIITSVDREGVNTTKEVKDFQLFEDRESVHEFQVPANLASIAFTLKARVQNLSQAKKVDLVASRAFSLNQIDKTEKIECLHLARADGQYFLELLGKTGEPRPDRPVQVTLKHMDFTDVVEATLQSDAKGRIRLGALDDIVSVAAQGPEGTHHHWGLLEDDRSYPGGLHGRAGGAVLVPYMGTSPHPLRSECSLLERRGNTFVRDRFSSLSIQDGYLKVQDLPPGDYDLWLKKSGVTIAVRFTEGEEREGHVLSGYRQLELRNPKPLQISSVAVDKEAVRVKIEGASKFARVHVLATRYLPAYPVFEGLDVVRFPDPMVITIPPPESQYVVGRDIGDEYRYIIERKYAAKHPGNLLSRPGLLLNPWAVRSTETGTQEAKAGEAFRQAGAVRGRAGGKGRPAEEPAGVAPAESGGFADLDFLGEPAAALLNLKPDAAGLVSIPRAALGAHPYIHILAASPEDTVYRQITLPETPMKLRDARLADGLDPKKHFTEQKSVSIAFKDAPFTIADITTSELETYDSLQKVFSLYATLSNDANLAEFSFVLGWPKLKPEEQREKYAKYACHELNFFLYEKDPKFFADVVKPYLQNKHDKTFLDRWLLGDELAEYLKPWAFEQLNIVEQILLARRIAGEGPRAERRTRELLDLLPVDLDRSSHLFKTALKGRALETADALGVEKAKGEAKDAKKFGLVLDRAQREVAQEAEAVTAARPSRARKAAPAASATEGAPPPAAPAMDRVELLEAEEAEAAGEDKAAGEFFARDAERRKAVRQLYRKLDKTQEWVENNYYHLPKESQNAGLITVNAFWADYARHDGQSPFFSIHVAEASRNFPEMMLALAVLDLPFEAGEHTSAADGANFTIIPGSPLIVFHKEVKEAQPSAEKTPILVTQNFYRHGDRYIHVGSERFDKYVTDEFLVQTVYGCQVVITNPTSSPQKLEVLVQIPRGAIPVLNGQYTRTLMVDLESYHTWTADYFFYFPAPGTFPHFPIHVSKNEKLLAFAAPMDLKVVETPTTVDKTSWDYISQHGTEDQVIQFMADNNLGRVKLDRIAWRMRDKAFFEKAIALLSTRHVYDHTLWSYGMLHDDPEAVREFLKHSNAFVATCGAALRSPILTIDPVERKAYEHMEYFPLVNARAHRLGKTRTILNNRFYEQYMRLMNILCYTPALDDHDSMSVVYYLVLQDRTEEAMKFFERVRSQNLASKLQYDYFDAYLAFAGSDLRKARTVAEKYAAYPVDRWRNLFAAALSQLDEVEGKGPAVVDEEDRTQTQTQLAATEPSFDFTIESGKVTINYQNLTSCRVNYYLMDIELLFSRNPFVGQYSGQFAFIRPNATDSLTLDPKKGTQVFPLPERFISSNVLVEIVGAGVKKARTHFSGAMNIQVIEGYAHAKVTHATTGKPLPAVYVKVYARMQDGTVRFYKDGYTDLRGRFDYGSLSTNELDHVSRFSLLVLSSDHGAAVREAEAPKR